jgi:hypothetical protein
MQCLGAGSLAGRVSEGFVPSLVRLANEQSRTGYAAVNKLPFVLI